ncbi:MAG: phosphatase PAP2 family protein [Spirochaetaceae bacterium]|nr:phosphatase PAP2 family protein [Spirochaetaceae bacterium]
MTIQKTKRAATIRRPGLPGLKIHDLAIGSLLCVLAVFSLIWPNTGLVSSPWGAIQRGYVAALVMAGLAALIFLVGRLDFSAAHPLFRFLRNFYPQIIFGPLFMEDILLSAQALGGRSHDAFFAGIDQALFGFQPALQFSRAYSSPFWTELMFGAYFSFYVILVVTPWIPWLRGDEEEAEREMGLFTFYMLFVSVFYVFFRVEGPKYWLSELRAANYADFRGGPITAFMCGTLSNSVLSGAAFPSSHVAGSVMMSYFVSKTERRLLPLYVVLTSLICLSTVYIRAHWAIDIAGGIVAALVVIPLFNSLSPFLVRFVPRLLQVRPANPRPGSSPRTTMDAGAEGL